MIRRYALMMVACIAFISTAHAGDVPPPQGPVNDFADVISAEYRSKLTSLILELERKTGAEIAVVTRASIAPYEEKQYARMVFDAWKIGKKGKDNGVLVLLAINERAWRIETGYGVEGILPDGRCGDIGRAYMVPSFKKGDYGAGIYYGVAAIADTIAKDANVTLDGAPLLPHPERTDIPPAPFALFLAIFFFIWNLPWPFLMGFAFTMLFALALFAVSPLFGITVILAYIASLVARFLFWRKQPPKKRPSFFGAQQYGSSTTSHGSGWGSSGGFGGGGFGGGGFGGGGGGGGGAGGRF